MNMTIENEDTGSGEADVTFVNGRAVEQNAEGFQPDGDHGDELAAAKEAVKKAMSAEAQETGKKAAKVAKDTVEKDPILKETERQEALKAGKEDQQSVKKPVAEAKTEAKPDQEEPDEDATTLRRALTERKELAKYKAEASAEIEKMRNEVRTFYRQLQDEKAQVAKDKEQLALLKKDPLRAIRENGWDPEEFILDIANDGTPEGQAKRREREREQLLNAKLKEIDDWKASQEQAKKEAEEEQGRRQYNDNLKRVETDFLRTCGAKGEDGNHKHPNLVSFYKSDPEELCEVAHRVADRYRAATTVRDQYGRVIEQGKEATYGEIAEYIEERQRKWYLSKSDEGTVAKDATQSVKGKPTQGSVTGKRSLNPSTSGERRSLGKEMRDLDGDERLEAAREAVRAALHASSD